MGKLVKAMLCAAVLAAVAIPAGAQDAAVVKRQAQNKLLSLRAARVDAIRKIAERIKGLMITSTTSVKDFVTENDQINTSMMAFLNGMREKGAPRYEEDGTCELTMEVTLRDVIMNLESSQKSYYKGNKVTIDDMQKMQITYKDQIITETGNGAPRPEVWEQTGQMNACTSETLTAMTNMSEGAKAFWMQYCTGQGRLMAVRAARVDGMRRLAERINGVFITSETTVKDFVAESDDVNVNMTTFLVGARETGIRYHDNELIVEVEMTVKLRTVYASLKSWGATHCSGDKVKMQKLEELSVSAVDKDITETGMGVPPEKYLKGVTTEMTAVMKTATNAPDWLGQKIRAVGNAAVDAENTNAAQAKLMAYRGAELDARRKIAEQIEGLMITSSTSVKDFVTMNDQIQTAMLTFQQGASVVEGSQKLMEDGTAEVTVEQDMRPLWDMIVYYEKSLSLTIK